MLRGSRQLVRLVKPSRYHQQCRNNFRLCRSNIRLCSIRQCFFDIVASVDRALQCLTRLSPTSCGEVTDKLTTSETSQLLDRCHTCNFVARFWRATLSRHKIASRHAVSHTATLSHKRELTNQRSPHFRDENVAQNRALL